MKTFTIAALFALTLLSCGQQEKTEDPFGRTGRKQKEPMSEQEFTQTCERTKKGEILRNICVAPKISKRYRSDNKDEKGNPVNDFDKIFEGGNPTVSVDLGNLASQGAIFGDVKGGLPVNITVNGAVVNSVRDPNLPPTLIGPGKVELRIKLATYEHLNVTLMECFTREAAAVPCPTDF